MQDCPNAGVVKTPYSGAIPVPRFRYRRSSLLPVLAAVILSGCGNRTENSGGPPRRPAMPVQVETAQVRDLTRWAIYTGSIEPTRLARVASPAEGPIVECAVREGDMVKTGQTLVHVGRSRMAASNLAAAREDLERQRSDFSRVERLVQSGALPGEQLDIARAALRRAEAQVEAAETSADDYELRAPWDGVVSTVFVAEGNYVAPRAPLVELYDPASLRVRFTVPERDARLIEVGAKARIMLDAFPGQEFDARIERIYPRLDPSTRTLTVEAHLETDEALFAGLFARVATPLETLTETLAVPSGAPVALPDGSLAVFVVNDGRAERRRVHIGLEAEGYTQILDGVLPGELVVVRGQESLRDGASVRLLGAQQAASASEEEAGTP